MRPPYIYKPKEDITTYELALLLPIFAAQTNYWAKNPNDSGTFRSAGINYQPECVKRHFEFRETDNRMQIGPLAGEPIKKGERIVYFKGAYRPATWELLCNPALPIQYAPYIYALNDAVAGQEVEFSFSPVSP